MWLIFVIALMGSLFYLAYVRNEIVYKVRMEAIDTIDLFPYEYHDRLWAIYELTVYNDQFFDLRKWTFAQFYPELVYESSDIMKEIKDHGF